MKKIIYVLVFLAFANLLNAQWQSIAPTAYTDDMNDIFFLDENTGFAAGEHAGTGIIIKTTNGGISWSSVYTTGSLLWVESIHFVNSLTGYACGKGGYVYSTTNSGQNWSAQNLGCTKLECIRFINASTGLTCGDGDNPNRGPIYKTTNGGSYWTKVNNSIYHMDKIFYLDANIVYASGDYVIWKSSDGGNTWTDIYPLNRDCNDIFFLNSNTGFVCGNYVAIKTTNAGVNWLEFVLITSDTNYYSSVYFTDNNNGYLSLISTSLGIGKIYKTTNTGANWYLQQTFSGTNNAYIKSIKFININTGFACGGGTTIWKTTNGGGPIGIQNISTEIPSKYSLSQNYPNPFNPTTRISFKVASYKVIKLQVFDILGKEVATLVHEKLAPGTYEATFDGSAYPSGVYFYKLTAGDFSETKKLTLIK